MTDRNIPGFEKHLLFGEHPLFVGRLPADLEEMAREHFDELWDLHPKERPEIVVHGRRVRIPRFQQAYGRPYSFSGITSPSLPVPDILAPFIAWVRCTIDLSLNGLLLNWYEHQNYIGAHRDDTRDLVPGTPIVTISAGEARTFRVRPFNGKGFVDFPLSHGAVCIMPWETNLNTKHEVPHSPRAKGRRISITARAFAGPRHEPGFN